MCNKYRLWFRYFIFLSFLNISMAFAEENIEYRFERLWPRLEQSWYLSHPLDVAIAPDGNIYVADKDNHRIQKLSAKGDFIQTWGSRGSDDGQFNYPKGLAIGSDGSVYVADSVNDRIQQFSAEGRFINVWGSKGSNEGQLNAPYALAIANDGSVYVTDHYNHRIQQFNAKGLFIRTWGRKGSEDGEFDSPEGVAIAPDGSVYVADTKNNRIQQFTPEGDFIQTWGSEGSEHGQFIFPSGISIASDGNVTIVDALNERIQQFTADGSFIQTWGDEGQDEGQFESPRGLAIAEDGSIFIADSGNDRIQKFAPKIKISTTVHPYKAIILAGGGEKFASGRTNSIWNGTWRIAQKAYNALTNQAFKAHKEIKFLTAGDTQIDIDQNKKIDDLEVATKESLRIVITEWASDATDVVIYLSNHGGPGKFKVNGSEILTSEELNDWVSQLEEKIPGKVTLVIEACNSASFFAHLSKPGRFLLASAKADQNAVISNDGFNSFSYTFWSEVATGAEVKIAFENARQSMSGIIIGNEAQSAQAETDGNNVFSQLDLDQLGDYCFGECNKTAGAAPEIKPFSPASQTLNSSILDFSVSVDSLQPLNTVWAMVQRPDDISIDTNQPLDFEKINLTCDKENLCKGQYTRFDVKGEYRLNVYPRTISWVMDSSTSYDPTALQKNTRLTEWVKLRFF